MWTEQHRQLTKKQRKALYQASIQREVTRGHEVSILAGTIWSWFLIRRAFSKKKKTLEIPVDNNRPEPMVWCGAELSYTLTPGFTVSAPKAPANLLRA